MLLPVPYPPHAILYLPFVPQPRSLHLAKQPSATDPYSPLQVNKAGSNGQRLTKVDRSDDIVPVQKTGAEIGANIRNRRSKEGPYKMTQAELAKKVNAPATDIKLLESGDAIKNQGLLNRVARVLKISPKTGKPLDGEE